LPTIDGAAIFGLATTVVVADGPRGVQRNAYPGLDGVEELDQGSRGRLITITGRLYGANASAMGAAEADVRSYNDGATHTIVDQFGVAWSYCKYESFEPQGRVEIAVDLNGNGPMYHRRYVARFRMLI
jgi:hypothetical protein